MQEQEKSNNSLFDWATSELSQDAVLLWLLDNKKVNKEVLGNLLGRNIKGEKVDNSLPYGIKENIETKKQEHYVDISVEFTDQNEKKHIVLIEDKTETELHDQQMIKYIAGIPVGYEYIHFVLFKTGLFSFVEQERFELESNAISTALKGEPELPAHVLKKDEERVNKYLDTIKDMKRKEISFHLFIPDSFDDICDKNNFSAGWKDEYIEFFKTIIDKRKHDERNGFSSFLSKREYSSEQFSKAIGLEGRKEIKGVFIRPNNGGGKRTYDFLILGFCGDNKDDNEDLKNRYYIKPIIRFSEKKDKSQNIIVEASIIVHFNWQVDSKESNDLSNYLPYAKLYKEQQGKFKSTRDVLDEFFENKQEERLTEKEKGKVERLQVYKSRKIPIINPEEISSYQNLMAPLKELLGYCDKLNEQMSQAKDAEELRKRLELSESIKKE